ncbi:MAG: 1-acyl-sn-glycerol-3-phosphate acyltransferase [Spirochaetes bacterium]|nr:1-acyl-sn-glycerol-3-phosphate acyltransferase [Spirochaetota bacterium]
MPAKGSFFRIAPIWDGETIVWYQVLYSGIRWAMALAVFLPVASAWFVLTFLVASRPLDPFAKWISRTMIRAAGVRVLVENPPPASLGTRLYVGNHVNIFDVFLYYGWLPGYVKGVELEDHFRWFLYGPIIRRLGNIPLSQKNPRAALASLGRAREALARGTSLIILPEGQRTLTGDFMEFKTGAFRLAKGAPATLIPVFMDGAWKIARRGSLFIRPGIVRLRFGDPLVPEATLHQEPHELRDRVLAELRRLRDVRPPSKFP